MMEFKSLSLQSKDIEKQKSFYQHVLGLQVSDISTDQFIVQLKNSALKFTRNDQATPYHFAINIPSNQEHEALDWLTSKVPILKFKKDEIVDFTSWNAKSIYFYDADFNIVELIARKNLDNQNQESFTSGHLLEISEIGVLTNSINESYQFLSETYDLPIFDGKMDYFCAAGNEKALFILIDKKKGTWFPADDKAFHSPFEIEFLLNGKLEKVVFDGETLH